MDAKSLLLTAAFRHTINEPNIEAGFERFAAIIAAICEWRAANGYDRVKLIRVSPQAAAAVEEALFLQSRGWLQSDARA